jgi:hypothetical protein
MLFFDMFLEKGHILMMNDGNLGIRINWDFDGLIGIDFHDFWDFILKIMKINPT